MINQDSFIMMMKIIFIIIMGLLLVHGWQENMFQCTCNENTYLENTCYCTVSKNCQNYNDISIGDAISVIKRQTGSIDLIDKMILRDVDCPINTNTPNDFDELFLTQLSLISVNINSIDKQIFNNLILKEISVLNNIKSLYLQDDVFIFVPKLESVELRNCSMYKLNNIFKNLTNLKYVDLSYNRIEEMPWNTFETNDELIYINISHNEISEIQKNTYNGLRNLITIDMSFNHLHIVSNGSFQNLKNLEKVYLHNNVIHSIEAEAFAHSPKIISISLNNNKLKTIVIGLPNLKILNLDNNPLKCDCAMKNIKNHQMEIEGHCFEPKDIQNKTVNELSVQDFVCKPKLNCSLVDHEDRYILACKIYDNSNIFWKIKGTNISQNAYIDTATTFIWSNVTILHSECSNGGYRIQISNTAGQDCYDFTMDCKTLKESDASGVLLICIIMTAFTAIIIFTIIYVNKKNSCSRKRQPGLDANRDNLLEAQRIEDHGNENEATYGDLHFNQV